MKLSFEEHEAHRLLIVSGRRRHDMVDLWMSITILCPNFLYDRVEHSGRNGRYSRSIVRRRGASSDAAETDGQQDDDLDSASHHFSLRPYEWLSRV